MTRRELLVLVKNVFIALLWGGFLGGCRSSQRKMDASSQIAYFLGYLLYEDNPPEKGIEEIEKHLETIVQNSVMEQLELELLSKINTYFFKTLSSEDKANRFKEIMPMLVQYPEILDALRNYLQGERVLDYLDYPDLPGEYGVCGWIVMEGTVWNRYYRQ